MLLNRHRARFAAPALVLALAITACGGDDSSDTPAAPAASSGSSAASSAASAAPTGGSFSFYIGEPENPLLPGNTAETEGGQVVDSLFTGLVTYNDQTTELEYNGVAESMTSEDNTTWNVKLKPGWTFHDGTPVTSDSFIDAWNYTALSTNGQGNSYFFANVDGYDALQAETDPETEEIIAEPTATEMTGLAKVDDLNFTVTLTEAFIQYPLTTGYTAFFPLPESFFAGEAAVEAFGRKPIGNGPFKADADFAPGRGITLSRYEEYAGDNKAKADSVELRVYTDLNTAYTDVQAGNLDIADDIPPDAIATAEDEFGDRYIERPSSAFRYLGFPTYDERFSDPEVRRAFSMAINRQAISDAIFDGAWAPAYSVVSPIVDGSRPDACAACQYDPAAAKTLLESTDFDVAEPVELWFNAGAGHDEWVQAVGNNLRENLGITYTLRGDLQFAEYLPLGDEKGFTGPFRLGWVMDYPSPQNYLEPLYSTDALPPSGSNASFYSNEEFDMLVDQGNAAPTNDEAIALYQQAEDVLLADMPIMPMFFGVEQGVHSENVDNVVIDAFARTQLADVTVNQ